jgi:agmatine deiminase
VLFRSSDLIPFKRFKADIVLEGGSIESNGAGTLLVTEQCLLNKNRNPGMSRTDIEKSLRDYLGVTNIVWLGEGLQGDDTDGHIDNLARFVNPTTVLALTEEDGAEANYAALKDNWERLVRSRDQNGKQWNLVKMPAPGSVMEGGRRLAASYVNFYIANRAVLVPTFGHRNDTRAIDILKDCFPEREIAAIPCRDLAVGGGSIHCVTQQEPA